MRRPIELDNGAWGGESLQTGGLMRRVLAGLALVSLVVVLIALDGKRADANHPSPDASFGYAYLHWDLYPSCNLPGWTICRDHDMRYRACTTYVDEASYAVWDWIHRFGFNSTSTLTSTREYNCGVGSDLLLWVTDDATTRNRCGGAQACYLWTGIAYDNTQHRWEVTSADITVSSSLLAQYSGNQGVRYTSSNTRFDMDLAWSTISLTAPS
jgi:hypothetical protein